jgi:Amt family ammonium transporter
MRRSVSAWGAGLAALLAPVAGAQEAVLDKADTAWIIVASALVLFMMIPALAMFYGGLVRVKNVLSLFMQCFVITALVSVLWLVYGYSLAFDTTGMAKDAGGLHAFIGGLGRVCLSGVTPETLRGTIPEALFFVFQATFAIITPGLFIGAFAERIKFSAVMVFTAVWVTVCYLPVCHMVWGGPGSFFGDRGVLDFAGGITVHLTAGVTALVAAIMVGKRKGYGTSAMPPHNMTMCLIGTAMLWVGWFGFNGGSALAANGQAAMAILVTHISPCVAALVWLVIEWVKIGKPSALGFATGAIAGLAAITPASGYVGPLGAVVIGLCSGAFCYVAATTLKRRFGYDDSLDVVGVHGGGGLVGSVLVAFFASPGLGGFVSGLNIGQQLTQQLIAIVFTIVYCGVASVIILTAIDKTIGLRVTAEQEEEGLDLSSHGEAGYDM